MARAPCQHMGLAWPRAPVHAPRTTPQVGTISEAYPHLIFDAFSSKLGERCANILKHIFPVPKDDAKRCVPVRCVPAAGCRMAPSSAPAAGLSQRSSAQLSPHLPVGCWLRLGVPQLLFAA